ncbi:hypothetical protein Pcinc_024194 [Petrolisthes cinctipes]|uniref:Uncharacterized protein n=1 Tax=Petrolisthes cinctipes TaxID=88211 RepID=A0AAE1FBL8_PETCI|nr:hypothetical protein Pcinc_024194 [Petrolisthes cinctipes]
MEIVAHPMASTHMSCNLLRSLETLWEGGKEGDDRRRKTLVGGGYKDGGASHTKKGEELRKEDTRGMVAKKEGMVEVGGGMHKRLHHPCPKFGTPNRRATHCGCDMVRGDPWNIQPVVNTSTMVSSLVLETQIADWCDTLESPKVVIASPHALIPPLSRLVLRRAVVRVHKVNSPPGYQHR